MAAQLQGTVYVTDPDTHNTVELAPGTSPEPRLAALVTNPGAWVDGKLPRLPKTKTDSSSENAQDDASGDTSGTSATADTQSEATDPDKGQGTEDTKPAARKTAARKTAASKPAAN